MEKIVVDDSYLMEMQEFFVKQGERFEEYFEKYIAIMRVAVKDGIQSGKTKEALDMYIDIAEGLKGSVDEISTLGLNWTKAFLEGIDKADEFLY